MDKKIPQGKVWLAGAGPGDAGLLTLRAKEVLKYADVVVYDALLGADLLAWIPEKAEKIDVGKRAGAHTMPQEEINRILLTKAQEGKQVVRLKGGDPFVFGRGGEELKLLKEHGIAFEVIPGVTSAAAVPAYAGIPVTHRELSSSFHVITGHAKKGGERNLDYEALVKLKGTLVFLMGLSSLPEICDGLLSAGMDRETCAAVISKGTLAGQVSLTAAVGTLAEKTKKAGIETPAVFMVGAVCKLAEQYAWAEHRPLGNTAVLLTRPREQISSMAEKLRLLGAQAIEMPTIRIKRLEHNPELKKALAELSQSEKEHWIAFTSPSGVRVFFEQLKEWSWDLRKVFSRKVKIAVLGGGTERELEKHGYFADFLPEEFSALSLGKLLADAWKKQENRETFGTVYLMRAKEGSPDLTLPLEQAGLPYQDIPCYETVFAENRLLVERVKEMLRRRELTFAVFTSASTVRGFVEALDFKQESEEIKTGFYAVCIGKKTAEEAGKYHMKILMADRAEPDSMIAVMCRKRKEEN